MPPPPESVPPESVPPEPAPAGVAPSCLVCATTASAGSAILTWVRERDERGRERWLCPACARRHVRDIEAKLDPEWW